MSCVGVCYTNPLCGRERHTRRGCGHTQVLCAGVFFWHVLLLHNTNRVFGGTTLTTCVGLGGSLSLH